MTLEVSKMLESELITKLSNMHKLGSKDPKALCEAAASDFDLGDPNYNHRDELQSALFVICRSEGYIWARD